MYLPLSIDTYVVTNSSKPNPDPNPKPNPEPETERNGEESVASLMGRFEKIINGLSTACIASSYGNYWRPRFYSQIKDLSLLINGLSNACIAGSLTGPISALAYTRK